MASWASPCRIGREAMKKMMYEAANYVDEVLDGLQSVHPDIYAVGESGRKLYKTTLSQSRVGVVSGLCRSAQAQQW